MKWISILLTIIALKGCGNENNSSKVKIKLNKSTFVAGDTLKISLKNKSKETVDSIQYRLNGKQIQKEYIFQDNIHLGDTAVEVTLFSDGEKIVRQKNIRLLSNKIPTLYTYSIINEFPHDSEAYTQGLEFFGDTLYESTGLKGRSSLRKVDFETGTIQNKIELDPSYFGEGITVVNNKIIQLTWQANTGFVYDLESMNMERSFNYQNSTEGWGLCNDGNVLYKSDGSAKIWKLDLETQKERSFIQATTHKTIVKKINELEWANGKIYANTYQDQNDVVLVINPKNGAIEGIVNFAGLRKKVKQIPSLNVLNGIAYHKERNTFFVTGKNWSKLFEVTLEKN